MNGRASGVAGKVLIPTMTAETKCGYCPGTKCCTYITQQVQTPRSRSDFDHLLWQVSHRGISIYKDEDGWYLLVETVCGHLGDDGRCAIYDRRPDVCRDYSNDYCEFDEPAEKNFELHFRDHASLERYVTDRFRRAAKVRQTSQSRRNQRSP